jgi:hypothetical protein
MTGCDAFTMMTGKFLNFSTPPSKRMVSGCHVNQQENLSHKNVQQLKSGECRMKMEKLTKINTAGNDERQFGEWFKASGFRS